MNIQQPRQYTNGHQLSILQYNVNRSKDTVMAQFMRDPTVTAADIIAIQEPWKNPFSNTTHHPAKDTHELLYPEIGTGEKEERTRVCMFVSKKLSGWVHTVHSRDVQELSITTSTGNLRILNIYNDMNTYAALHLLPAFQKPRTTQNS